MLIKQIKAVRAEWDGPNGRDAQAMYFACCDLRACADKAGDHAARGLVDPLLEECRQAYLQVRLQRLNYLAGV
jgi:hypothetical protein